MQKKNHKFWLESEKELTIKSQLTTEEELEKARKEAKQLIKKSSINVKLRSCW